MSDIFSQKELIYTIYQEQSISAAAKKLFLTQPSLSIAVRRLEDKLGVALFDRSAKPLRLTDAGKQYIKAAMALSEIEKSFSNYLSSVNHLETGALTVGSNQLLSASLLAEPILQFTSAYPNIHFQLINADSQTLARQLQAGELELIVDNSPLSAAAFTSRPLQREQLLLAVPTEFPVNKALGDRRLTYQDIRENRHLSGDIPFIQLSDFSDVPFILLTRDNDTRLHADKIFAEESFSPRVILELQHLTVLYHFIERGAAASIISDTFIRNLLHWPEKVVFYKLPSLHSFNTVSLSYRKNYFFSPALSSFIKTLETFAGTRPESRCREAK